LELQVNQPKIDDISPLDMIIAVVLHWQYNTVQ